MKKIYCALLLLLGMVSCYNNAQEPNFDMTMVLPADSMVILLAELHMADAIVDNIKDKELSFGHLSSEYFDAVMKNHHIERDVFEESMRYYAFHTEELSEIYEKVIIALSKKESLMITPQEAKENLP